VEKTEVSVFSISILSGPKPRLSIGNKILLLARKRLRNWHWQRCQVTGAVTKGGNLLTVSIVFVPIAKKLMDIKEHHKKQVLKKK
jgi:hypothetical protein